MCLLLSIFAAFPPQTVMLNRGNHEDYAICCVYGFQAECVEKYDEITFGMFVEVGLGGGVDSPDCSIQHSFRHHTLFRHSYMPFIYLSHSFIVHPTGVLVSPDVHHRQQRGDGGPRRVVPHRRCAVI